MKSIITTILLILCSYQSYAQWDVYVVYPPNNLDWVHFLDSSRGFIVGHNGSLYKTVNGGVTWTYSLVDSAYPTDLFCIQFVNDSTGWISGRFGRIYKTTNGGVTWTYISSYAGAFGGNYLTQILFRDAYEGWVMGSTKFLCKTNSAGEGWCITPSGYNTKFQKIHMVDDRIGYANGDSGRAVKTTDGGITWKPLNTGNFHTLNSLTFINAEIGFMVGVEGTLLKTTNGGTNWFQYPDAPIEYYSTVRFTDGSNGWIVGANGMVLRTSNTGATWVKENIPTKASFIGSFFLDANHGWAIGEQGTVLRYHPLTPTAVPNGQSTNTLQFDLQPSYPNPFNPSTTITFTIPSADRVELTVFDILGKEIQTLLDRHFEAGTHSVVFTSAGLASGTYVYRLTAGAHSGVKKMVLTK